MKLFQKLTGERIYAELVLMFSEAEPAKALRRMGDLDVLKFIHPSLKGTTDVERLFLSVGETLSWFRLLYLDFAADTWYVYFLALFDRMKDAGVDEALERLAVPARVRERVRQARTRSREVLYEFYRSPDLSPSRVYGLLHPLGVETLLLMMAKARQETAKKYISLYLTRLRQLRVALTGDDLKAIGIPPGPRYRRILSALLDAKLDGTVTTIEDEREFVLMKAGAAADSR
jgi:tRNA nucleotidyltransferase (CCA-adding enzyme)